MRSHHQRTIEHLARESQVPVDEVAQLYDEARAELEVGARIKGFLGIFAIGNVRKLLRQRKLQALEARPDLRRQVQRYGCARRCLSAEESAPYLKLPVGKELSGGRAPGARRRSAVPAPVS